MAKKAKRLKEKAPSLPKKTVTTKRSESLVEDYHREQTPINPDKTNENNEEELPMPISYFRKQEKDDASSE